MAPKSDLMFDSIDLERQQAMVAALHRAVDQVIVVVGPELIAGQAGRPLESRVAVAAAVATGEGHRQSGQPG